MFFSFTLAQNQKNVGGGNTSKQKPIRAIHKCVLFAVGCCNVQTLSVGKILFSLSPNVYFRVKKSPTIVSDFCVLFSFLNYLASLERASLTATMIRAEDCVAPSILGPVVTVCPSAVASAT